MEKVECIVIGAGVVGLSIARELSLINLNPIIVDSEASFGQGISSRNSEVIHAGIYYPKNSLKSELCLRGKNLLYEYCADRNIPHRKCGKLIVATSKKDENKLVDLLTLNKDIDDLNLSLITKKMVSSLEPNVKSHSAILSPTSGIIDSHLFMESLITDINSNNGLLVSNTKVTSIERKNDTFEVSFSIEGSTYSMNCDYLINSSGLGAQNTANSIKDYPKELIPKLHLCKGTYLSLSGIKPFKRLIYPVPPERMEGLGIHSTIDLEGNVRFGPDTEYIKNENYIAEPGKINEFIQSISKYYPNFNHNKLHLDYCGVRPKLQGPDDGFIDFEIQNGADYGFDGLVNLFGIESPGLTASLAIAEKVGAMIKT